MAQSQREPFNHQFGERFGLNPKRSLVGKLVAIGVLGVAVTVAGAVGVGAALDVPPAAAGVVGGVGATVLVVSLVVVGRLTVGELRELNRKADEIENGNYEVELSNDRTDEVGQLYDRLAGMQESLDTRVSDLETLNKRITRVVRDQAEVVDSCGAGDMTVRMDTDTGVPQFDAFAENFNRMVDDTEDALAESKQFSQAVAVASNETTASIREVQNQIADVIEASETISEGVARQDQRFAQTATEMSNLSATIEEVAASADELTEQSRETVRTTQRGREAAQEAVGELDTIRGQAGEAVEAVETLEREVDQIHEIVDLIREIADETNLLAVNAQIEAAHAGEIGEGFGLVADRIKGLADETTAAAEDIEVSLEALQERTDTTTDRIEKTRETVERGTDTIEDALGALDEINTVVEETNVSVQQIDDATKEQAKTAEEVVRMIDEVADISEQTAGQAEEVVESTRQQSESVAQVDRSVDNLADQAAQLSDSLGRFTVREGSTRVEPTVDATSD